MDFLFLYLFLRSFHKNVFISSEFRNIFRFLRTAVFFFFFFLFFFFFSAKSTHQNGDLPEHREKHHYSKVRIDVVDVFLVSLKLETTKWDKVEITRSFDYRKNHHTRRSVRTSEKDANLGTNNILLQNVVSKNNYDFGVKIKNCDYFLNQRVLGEVRIPNEDDVKRSTEFNLHFI